MDAMVMGMHALETTMNVGLGVVDSIDQVIQLAADDTPVTCEVSRCEWN